MSAVVLSGGRVLNIGGAAFSVGAVIPPPPPGPAASTQISFTPGHWMGTENAVQGCPVAQAQTEINLLAAGNTNVQGYWYGVSWSMLENFALTTNTNTNTVSGIDTQYPGFQNFLETVANYFLINVPGKKFGFWLTMDKESGTGAFTTTYVQQNFATAGAPPLPQWMLQPATLTVPDFFGASTTSLYSGPVGQIYSGASAHGFMFSQYNSVVNAYTVVAPHWHNPGIVQGMGQMIQAMSQYVIKGVGAGTAPFAGKTFGQCSWFEGFSFNDEVSWNFTQNIPSGSIVNPPQTTGGAPVCSNTAVKNGYKQLMTIARAAFPQQSVGICYSFGVTTDSGTDSNANIASDVNGLLAGGAGLGLSNIRGLAMGSSDWFANEYNLNSWTNGQANPGYQGMLGVASPVTPVVASPLAPTGSSILGKMRWNKQLQPEDYHFSFATGGSVPAYSTALLQGILQGAIYDGSTHIIWGVGDDAHFGTNAWTGGTGWTGGGVYAFIQTATGLSTLLPQYEMYAPTGLVAIATSTTTATISWNAITNQGTGLSIVLYRDDTAITSGPAATFTSYNDTGLVASSGHGYKIAMSNANGLGPYSNTFNLTMPVFFYPNFASGTGAQSAIQTVASYASFVGNTMQVTSGNGHTAGAANYKTQITVTSWQTQFTFQVPGPISTVPTTMGLSFFLQNSNTTTNPNNPGSESGIFANGDANLCGFGCYSNQIPGGGGAVGGIRNSVGIKFDLNPNNYGGDITYNLNTQTPNQTGLYVNGGPYGALVASNDLNPYGINLYSGHTMQATIWYDGSIVTMVLLDTVSGAQAREVWGPVSIPTYIDAVASPTTNLAWIGFGAGTVGTGSPPVNVLSWNFTQGFGTRLATPTLSPAAGQYAGTQTVTISGPSGASLYYTINGLLPTSASTLYSAPITVSASEVVQVVAIQTGYTDSLVATANYQIGTANLINRPSGFATNDGMVLTGYAYRNGTQIQLTDNIQGPPPGQGNFPGQFQVSAAWFAAPVVVSSFTTNFSLKFANVSVSGGGLGATFCIQNQPTSIPAAQASPISGGTTALGADSTALGYGPATSSLTTGALGGIQSSVALSFNLTNNSIGLYSGGVIPSGSDVATGITFNSNTLNVALTYSGTSLTVNINSGAFTHTFTGVNIPTLVGGSTAYVGFTAASGFTSANQWVENWTFN